MKLEEKRKRIVYNIDLDGTLTNGEPFWDKEPTPNIKNVKYLRELFTGGDIIIIHTARMWEYAPETVGWLIKHRIPFHGVRMGKGGSDCYIDDKSTNKFPQEKKEV